MRFDVVWSSKAERELADLFLEASDRYEVRLAADWLDQQLGTQPDRIGVEVHEGLLVTRRSPLKIFFSISAEDRRVEVLQIRRMS